MNGLRWSWGMTVLLVGGAVLLFSAGGVGNAYAGDELTPPKLIASSMVQPVYPADEMEAGIQGTVLLNVDVKADGTVGKIVPKEEVEKHPAFTSAASAAVAKWRFEPAQKNGKAVAITMVVPVKFALEEKKK